MKTRNFALIIALVALFGFSIAACGGGGGGGSDGTATYTGKTDNGKTYTLKISAYKEEPLPPTSPSTPLDPYEASTTRYVVKVGDEYELTAESKRSEGDVLNVAGSLLTLRPKYQTVSLSNPYPVTFTASVSENGLTALDGKIIWTDGTQDDAPGALTPSKGNNGGGNNTSTGLSALVGKWYQNETGLFVFEITSDRKFIFQSTTYDMSISGNTASGTVNLKFGSTPVGTFAYALNNGVMVIIKGTDVVGNSIAVLSPFVKEKPLPSLPIPVADDFYIGNLMQMAWSVTAVTITPKEGKSGGQITVYYNGSTTIPQTAGTYTVTFNVEATRDWDAVRGLNAGTLRVYAVSETW